MKCRSLVAKNYQDYELREFDVPFIEEQFLLLEVRAAPLTKKDLYMMKNNERSYPFIPGSEAVGRVEEIGRQAAEIYNVKKGDVVYVEPAILCGECKNCLTGNYSVCEQQKRYGTMSSEAYPFLLGSFSKYMVVIPGSRVHKIKEDIPVEYLSKLGTAAKALRSVSKKGLGCLGKSMMVLGLNLFGVSCIEVAKNIGVDPIKVFDKKITPTKMQLANEFGINLVNELKDEKYDLIIDTLGQQPLFDEAVKLLKPLGKYLLPSGYILNELVLPVTQVVSKEIEITGVSEPSWDVKQALQLIKSPDSILNKLINKEYSLENFNEALNMALNDEDVVNVIIKP